MTDKEKTVEEYLAETGEYAATTLGISMYPLLKNKQYAVKIVPVTGRLRKYDVALFRRGKQLVLHRVIKVRPECYYIRGDNCEDGEWVYDSQVVGVLKEITGKDKHIKTTDKLYILYSYLTVFFYPCQFVIKKLYRIAKQLARRVLKNER